jgi:hypothetical protein
MMDAGRKVRSKNEEGKIKKKQNALMFTMANGAEGMRAT